jgi:Ca-activated chloride channel homolog
MRATTVAWLVAIYSLGASAAPSSFTPPATTEGRLVTRDGKTVVDVPLEHTDVRIRVDGYLADATVTQRFKNPYDHKIEAVYLFPLPTTAAVSELAITIGGRTIKGAIAERAKATAVYEAARARGNVAALLTQERPNLFTQQVANLEPGATVEVTLRYVQPLEYDSGGYELAFPMVAGPRYLPGGAKHEAVQPAVLPAGLRSSHDISLRVDLDAGVPITGLSSPSHKLAMDKLSASHVAVVIAAGDTIPNKDFVMRYRVAGAAPQFGVLAHRDGGNGSFLLVAQPPASVAAKQITPRELVFVLDTSSSMRGAPLEKAKQLIRTLLGHLGPDDTFQIVRFDDRASALGEGPIANNPRNIDLVLEWLAKLDAAGGTEMTTGISAALAVPHDPARLRIVAFLTDGYVGNEDEILAQIGKRIGDARLFSFGVGAAVNRYLLDEMASVGRGAVTYVRPDEDTAAAIGAFERRIATPVLTDLRIDWGGLAVRDVTPRALPDLFAGQPVVLAGHYTAPGRATVTVHAKQAGRDVTFAVPVELPARAADRPAVASVWARRRIAELSRALVRGDNAPAQQEIIALSLAHHVLTQFTAFVAVDDARVTAGGAAKRVVVPVEVPDAVAGLGPAVNGVYGFGAGGGGSGWGTIGVGHYGTIGYGSGTSSGYGYGEGHGGMRGATAAIPTVVIAQPMVMGSLDAAIIRRYIKRNTEKIRYCYEKQLLQKPALDGTVTVTFTIGTTGTVTASAATGLDPEVATCVAGVIKQIEFPKAQDSGVIQVNYPFTFHKAGG